MKFQKWLESKEKKTKEAAELFSKMKAHGISFFSLGHALGDLESRIDNSRADDVSKKELKALAGELWDQFQHDSCLQDSNSAGRVKSFFSRDTGLFFIAIFLIALMSLAFFGKNNFINRLADIQSARGLITFLFALGTIGMALIITISVFTSDRTPEESKERFYRAKEILTILIGILGTIVGFYFGTPADSQNSIEQLNLSPLVISTDQIVAAQEFTIVTLAKGGTPPYTYTLIVKKGDQEIANEKAKHVKGGLMVDTLNLEKGAYTINLGLEDSKGQTAKLAKDITVNDAM